MIGKMIYWPEFDNTGEAFLDIGNECAYKLVPIWSIRNPVSGADDFLTSQEQYDENYDLLPPVGYLIKPGEEHDDQESPA